jgi:molybdopterin molybdotransferase
MLQLEEALAQVLSAVSPPAVELVPLTGAHGRVLAKRVASPVDLPHFDNSSMDGYAVRAADVHSATPASPVRLRLLGRAAAGEPFQGILTAGTCIQVATGSLLPRGAEAVVMQEDTRVEQRQPDQVLILETAAPRENVRARGEDVQSGATLAEAGTVLTASRLSLLAAAGLTHVPAGCQPVVGLIATGSELKEPGQPLDPGQIYESNRLGLAALIQRAGAIPRMFPLVPDELAATRAALEDALRQCDVLVTSGGVSVGERDFIKAAIQEGGGSLQFWKVAIKPGRPFAFGRLGGKLLFGLPGNPVSALITFLLLVRPALLRCQGAAEIALPTHPGRLAESLVNRGERRHFFRVRVDQTGQICSAGLQASHALGSLAAANGLVDVPPHTTLEAGASVQVLRWD